MLVVAALHGCNRLGDHPALAFIQVPPSQVFEYDVIDRITLAVPRAFHWLAAESGGAMLMK